MAKIVLAHGILGFGTVFPDDPVNYFNGIKALYESEGHEVLCPTVPALGSLAERAAKLETQIAARWGASGVPLFAVAHSMGGLDCRRVIATSTRLQGRFRRLITVATPHFGSPVASTLLAPPALLAFSPLKWILSRFAADTGALLDLESRTALQDKSAAGVDYLCIGCDASLVASPSALFTASALLGGLGGVANDGVVSLASASHLNDPAMLLARWPVDHGGAIGWPTDNTGIVLAQAVTAPPPDHLARYRALLAHLVA